MCIYYNILNIYKYVDQPSIAISTVSIAGAFCRMRHDFAQRIVKTLLHNIIVSRDMAWARASSGGFNNRGAIADQPRTNRGFHRHFLKIELIWVVRLWTLLFWFFFAIGYHYWTQCLGRPEYSTLCYMPCNIDFSTSNSRFFYNKCLSQSRTNRRSITMQGFTIADAEIHMPLHNS